SAPCGSSARPDCRYVRWRQQKYRPFQVVLFGRRAGRQRYLCQVCNHAFFEPSHDGIDRPPFKEYRLLEALSTLSEWPDTSQGDVATRLLVDKSTVSVWVKKARGQPHQLLTPGIVDAGQLARRTG